MTAEIPQDPGVQDADDDRREKAMARARDMLVPFFPDGLVILGTYTRGDGPGTAVRIRKCAGNWYAQTGLVGHEYRLRAAEGYLDAKEDRDA